MIEKYWLDPNASVDRLFRLDDKKVVVTGAGMGIGREIAKAMLEMGAAVACTSRSSEKAKQTACELTKITGGTTLGLELDVIDEDSVISGFRTVREKWGQVDILINNAGGGPTAEFYDVWNRKLSDWQEVIDVNLTGTFLCTREAAKDMRERREGVIVNIASAAGLVGRDRRMYEGIQMRPNLIDYSAAKAGVIGFTRDAAAELGHFGIRVNSISPGGVFRNHHATFHERYSTATPLRRMAKEGCDMRGAAVFLASPASAYMTGANIVVDGGFSIFK